MWRDMLGEFEKNINQFANQSMASEEFSKVMHTVTGAGAGAKKTMGHAMERYLSTLNLPSRADITTVSERLNAIEAKLNELTLLLHTALGEKGVSPPVTPAAPKPPRTKKPPPKAGGTP